MNETKVLTEGDEIPFLTRGERPIDEFMEFMREQAEMALEE